MKIGGIDPSTLPSEVILVLPRGDKQIVFRARGLSDMAAFDALCPEPQAPVRFTPDGVEPNPDDPGYRITKAEYDKRRMAYMVVASLEPSQIEWDTVDLNVAGTWANWQQDLQNGGLNQFECNRVLGLCLEANSLDEAKLKKAREVFLRGPQPGSAA